MAGLLVFALPLIVAISWFAVVAQRRARKRYLAGLCAYCANALPLTEAYRIEGRVVCSACAARMRRRFQAIAWGLVITASLGAILITVGTIRLWRSGDTTWWLFPTVMVGLLGFLALLGGTILKSMKQQNKIGELMGKAHVLLDIFRPPTPPN